MLIDRSDRPGDGSKTVPGLIAPETGLRSGESQDLIDG